MELELHFYSALLPLRQWTSQDREKGTNFFLQLASSQRLSCFQHVSPELDLLGLVLYVLQESNETNQNQPFKNVLNY